MQSLRASINQHPITEVDRKFRRPLGRRADDHVGLGALALLALDRTPRSRITFSFKHAALNHGTSQNVCMQGRAR
jgi:hypothetical protein